ncbi:TonB-dependent siderophore receptor [Zhongshania aliphaticivorans]|uniref:TonB-dependent siderophore receptor n=1 Tax=Zhongshania aliphaticivorans TaxID=1470434 RepID=UPI0012E4BF15|nr:TonB-dependent receptor [Zhongshania aliphaticivorans]CAA0119645.1 Ferripyoverdine receptor [Zhongshania aliphaticivorans]
MSRFKHKPLAFAISLSLLASPFATIYSSTAAAEAAINNTATTIKSFNINAGPLSQVLSQFAGAAGVALSFDASLFVNQVSSGIEGSYSVEQGFALLLAGSGQTAARQSNGDYVLKNTATNMLPSVKISASTLGATSEGTDSYTTGSNSTATGMGLTLRETPQSVSVMTRSRIEDQGLNEISEVLEQTVGINYVPSSGLGTDGINYYARGFEVKNYQVNGVSRPTTVYGFKETTADMAVYDKVEVVRGATGLLNGVGPASATVNLIRKRATRDFQAYVEGQTGSWDRYRTEADVSGSLSKDGHIRGRIVAAYQQNESYVDRMQIEKQVLFATVDVDLSHATVLTLGAEFQEFENRGASRGGVPIFYSDGSRTHFSRSANTGAKWNNFYNADQVLFGNLEHLFDNGWTADVNIEYSRPEYDETIGYLRASSSSSFDPVTGEGANLLTARWMGDLEQTSVSFKASGPFAFLGWNNKLVMGANYSESSDEGNNYPGWWLGGDYSRPVNPFELIATGDVEKADLNSYSSRNGGEVKQSGAFTAVQLKPIERLSVIVGARLTNWKEREWNQVLGAERIYNDKTEENGVVTPYTGLVFDINEQLSAYLSYTQIFEPQTAEDINGSTLAPLEGTNKELGLKAELFEGRLNISAALFQVEQDNLALGIPDTFNSKGNQAHIAVSGTSSEGYELEISGELLPGWQVGGGISHTEVDDKDNKPLLSHIPEDNIKFFSRYQFIGALKDLTVGGNLRWQGRSYNKDLGPNGEDFSQSNFYIIDLMAKYQLMDNLQTSVNVNNVFDKTYYASHANTAVYGAPRQFIVSAKYTF